MIELTHDRDILLQSHHIQIQDPSSLISRLHLKRSQGPPLHSALRTYICDLAYQNTILVISTRPKTQASPPNPNSSAALYSTRATLAIITQFSRESQLLCVWVWLYYAFTDATVIFLHCIANPLHADIAPNHAAISDLENIC